jgi:uracil-DNA glycosylase
MNKLIMQSAEDVETLSKKARECALCSKELPLGPKPIIQTHQESRILIVGQAPGIKAHDAGVPFKDKSGERLRDWMGMSETDFYNPKNVAIVPMGFCYPGKAKSGDLPPTTECARTWQSQFQRSLSNVRLRLLIGLHAQRWHLGASNKLTLTDTVINWREYSSFQGSETQDPENAVVDFPLPHPSPRNNIWLAKNSWFEQDVLPALKKHIARLLQR